MIALALFSLNQPSGSIQSLSRNVRDSSVCQCVPSPTSLLLLMEELTGGGSVAGAVGVCDR